MSNDLFRYLRDDHAMREIDEDLLRRAGELGKPDHPYRCCDTGRVPWAEAEEERLERERYAAEHPPAAPYQRSAPPPISHYDDDIPF